MISLTYDQLNTWLIAFAWPFFRILAAVGTAPVIGDKSVPMRVKIGLSVFLTLIVAPVVGPLPQVSMFSLQSAWIIVNQVLVGVALGFAMQLAFAAIVAAGDIIGVSMGLSFATFFDPRIGGSSSVISNFVNMIGTLAFLSLDGHLRMIAALVYTFHSLPVAAGVLGAPGWHVLVNWSSTVFWAGLWMALPVVVVILIINIVLGILNRAAPQIGVFQIGLPMTMLVGLLSLQLLLPSLGVHFDQVFNAGINTIQQVAVGLRSR